MIGGRERGVVLVREGERDPEGWVQDKRGVRPHPSGAGPLTRGVADPPIDTPRPYPHEKPPLPQLCLAVVPRAAARWQWRRQDTCAAAALTHESDIRR
ncbi:hypothetical protein E2C01_048684 [Portunus trituberculatus]|uniref:Uncharacterized protein n=1 Tax=Portunus trituberculatus TaxID=210409 RepID=A0A5B7GAU5_PORTR|nr:hypothetical protein [Portunus trituberculatus]